MAGAILRFSSRNRLLNPGAGLIRLPLNRQVLIGRDESNDLRLLHHSVSRRHGRLVVENNHFILTDVGSANGSLVNGHEIMAPTILKPGDLVKLGDFEFYFEELDRDGVKPAQLKAGQVPDEATEKIQFSGPGVSKDPLLSGEPVILELEKPGPSNKTSSPASPPPEVINHPLRSIPPFEELDPGNFKRLATYFREETFKAGTEIAREGQTRGAFFVILDGTIVISRKLDQGRSRLVLGEFGPGTVYGERTVFADLPFANTVEAKTSVHAFVLDEGIYLRDLAQNRTINSFFQHQVSTNSAANWLKGTLLMQTLSDRTRRSIAGRLRFRVYQAGQTLARKGDLCEDFFLIVGGVARAFSVDKRGVEESLTMLEEGDYFGDGLAAEGETYPITVRAERTVECYVLARADFQNVLQKSGEPIASLGRGLSGLPISAVLNRIPPFNTMPPQLVAQIGSRMKVKYFKKGEVIFAQNQQSSALYIVRSGQVQLSYRTSDGTKRNDAKLGPGQFFGEASLLAETVHAATVTAIEDCELLTLFRNKLQEVIALGEGYALGQFFARNVERRFRPKRVLNFQMAEQTGGDGEKFYVLSQEDGENYFRLSDRGYFLWQRMDGDNTISDLALDYFTQYKVLDLEAVSNTVGQLQAAGFLLVPAVNQSLIGSEMERKRGKIARYFTFRYEIKNIDNLADKLYRYGGKFFFLKPVTWALFVLMGLGLISFIYFSFFDKSAGGDASFLLKPPVSIFNNSMWWFLLLFAFINFVIHESAHALACKSYHRKVSRGGFGWLYVGPFFFVNTDDIYLEGRKARITVDMAGPISNTLIGSLCCLLMFVLNEPEQRLFLFQMASVAFIIAFININPLMELDGYYALSNLLEIPSLRRKALGYIRRTVLRQRHSRPVSPRERKIFFWFALLIPLYLGVTILEFLIWFSQILNGLFASRGVQEPYLSWLSWGPAGILAVLLSLPLFSDLFSPGNDETETGRGKPKFRRAGR